MARLTSEPAAFLSRLMYKHMDDGVLAGPNEALDRTGRYSFCHESSTVGVGDKISRETVDQDGTGLASCKTLRPSVVLCWFGELRSCAFSWCEKPLLVPAGHGQYRTIVGRLMFLVAGGPDTVPEEWEIRPLGTCRGLGASVDISWACAIGH